MKFTVFGASGFIGGQLVNKLNAQDGNIVSAPMRHDITTNLDKILSQDLGHVFYCIGLTANFRDHPFATVEAHVCLLNRILEQGHFSSLTYLSSTRVYEGSDKTDESAICHASPSNPEHLYNLSKLMGESLCLNSGCKIKISRLSNVFGSAMQPKNFIRQILQEGAANGKVHFLTAAQSTNDYVSVSDVTHWLPQIALKGKHAIYNVASGKNTSNADIANLLKQNKMTVSYATDAPEWSFPVIDTSALNQEFGHAKNSLSSEFDALYRHFNPSK